MSDWNEDNLLNGNDPRPEEPSDVNEPAETFSDSEQETAPGNPESESAAESAADAAGVEGEPAGPDQPYTPEPEKGPERNDPWTGAGTQEPPRAVRSNPNPDNGDIWAYSWDGKAQKPKKSKKGAVIFAIIAAVCLILCVAVCVPTILYSYRAANQQPAGNESRQAGTTSTPDVSKPEPDTSVAPAESVRPESSVEVDETIRKSDRVYQEQTELTDLWDRCSPSCATIYVETSGRYSSAYIGSGFVLTPDGYIATNQHLVEGGATFTVIFYDGTEYEATLVGEDAMRDLAVLKIDAHDLPVLEIGDSSLLRPGQTVIAIGTPYDFSLAGTMTCGIVSGVNREIAMTDDYGRAEKTMMLIQTDATINPGNSGGPLINLAGQVVGINFMKLQDEYEGLGFAIPINNAVQVFNQLIQYGSVVQDPMDDFVSARAQIGVTVSSVEAGLESTNLRPSADYPKEGAFVVSINPNSSAYRAGLKPYCIIVEFGGEKVDSVATLTSLLKKYKAGDTVKMRYYAFSAAFNSGTYETIEFTLDRVS